MNFFNSLIEWPTYRFILVAVFLTGLAHIAFLPPFEGFDETAHWSSISIWGHEGRMPIYGEDLLDKAVRDYDGPLPYVGEIPYGQNGLLTYQSFDPLIHAGPHQTSPPQKFEQLGGINWQAQHPPLYYILLQPVFKVFNGLD